LYSLVFKTYRFAISFFTLFFPLAYKNLLFLAAIKVDMIVVNDFILKTQKNKVGPLWKNYYSPWRRDI